MSFLEPVIAVLIGAGITGLAAYLKKNIVARNILKYGPIVKKAYDIIDPVLEQNLQRWNGSKVDKAFELAIEAVSDGSLDSGEIKKLAFTMAKDWLPQVAADKVRALEASSPELRQAAIIAAQVDAISS